MHMKQVHFLIIFVVFAAVGFLAASLIRGWSLNKVESTFADLPMEGGLLVEPVRFEGTDYLIPPDQIYDTGLDAETTPALDATSFVSVAAADSILADEVQGIIVPTDSVARFYSYQILNWHEVVNETIGNQKLAITHCILCRSSAVYNRVVNGQELTFEISGSVYNNNTLLRDRETGSLWLQGTGLAVAGELIGSQLERVAAPVMAWEDFKDAFPAAESLSTDTGFDKDYQRHPYMNYDVSQTIYFPLNNTDTRISNKWIVNGVSQNGEQVAFAEEIIENDPVQEDVLGDERVVALHDFDTGVTSVLKPVSSQGEELTFTFDFEEREIRDETGSLWTPFGLAVDGPLKGERLEQIPAPDMFWFCWAALHPDTRVNQLDL